ncbi:MAG: hypothetical protein LBH20_02080 [Treponema sp.]|jgi:hypothetical protein|nr:hypothetical protein [Treponema sp.]
MNSKRGLIVCIFVLCSCVIFAKEFPCIKYVNSKDGLNKRGSPSVSSEKIGTLLHGTRVYVSEKSDSKVTIDGITDYWYRCSRNGWFWVFGGYLSATMPDDTEPVLGYWNTDREVRDYWDFEPDHIVSTGRKEAGHARRGTWTLSGNKLTIIFQPWEHNLEKGETLEIILTIINRDRIVLNFADGRKETLDMNNNLY